MTVDQALAQIGKVSEEDFKAALLSYCAANKVTNDRAHRQMRNIARLETLNRIGLYKGAGATNLGELVRAKLRQLNPALSFEDPLPKES